MDQNSNTMNNNPATGERTFTQEEVNRIVSERLAKEKAKAENALAEREQAISKRERMFEARKKLQENGLSVDLVEVMDTSSDEALDKAIDAFKRAISTNGSRQIVENKLPESHERDDYNADMELRKAMGLPR